MASGQQLSPEMIVAFAALSDEELARVAYDLSETHGWFGVVREVLIYQHRLGEFDSVRKMVHELIDAGVEERMKQRRKTGH